MEVEKKTPEEGTKVTRARRRLYEAWLGEGSPAFVDTVPVPTEHRECRPAVCYDTGKEKRAREIIKRHVLLSGGIAFLPVPLMDMAAVTAIGARMLRRLCDNYELEFSKERVKSLVASLLGGWNAGLIAGSLFKAAPLIGLPVVVASSVVAFSAITYALGTIFMKHFATGGSLLDFDPEKHREDFSKAYEQGKRVIS